MTKRDIAAYVQKKVKRLPGDSGSIKHVTAILHSAISTGSAPAYLFSFVILEKMVAKGWLTRGRISDFHSYYITESGKQAFASGLKL